MSQLTDFIDALASTDSLRAKRILVEAQQAATDGEYVDSLIVPALEHIGTGWEHGEYALSQVYMSGRICEDFINTLFVPLKISPVRPLLRIAVTTLSDYHSLGRRMVCATLIASGYPFIDYGRMDIEELVARIANDEPDILLISVLMYSSALDVLELRQELQDSGIDIKIAVGGAPFRLDQQLWKQVGADATGNSSSDVISIIRSLDGGKYHD